MTIRADLIREQGQELLDDGFSLGNVFRRMHEINNEFSLPLSRDKVKALYDEIKKEPEPAVDMRSRDVLLEELAYIMLTQGKPNSMIVQELIIRSNRLYDNKGKRIEISLTYSECLVSRARRRIASEEPKAGALHAETCNLAMLAEFCDKYNVCISRRAEKWNAFYGSGRIVSEADWETFITKVVERVT